MSRKSKLLVKRLATVLCYVEFYPCHVQNGLSKLRSRRITIRVKIKVGQVSFVMSLKSSSSLYIDFFFS